MYFLWLVGPEESLVFSMVRARASDRGEITTSPVVLLNRPYLPETLDS